ncbi:MAG: bacteriocin [Tannerella sp.]|jgi:natural product precursor|nr:bacteriocin [Tannerella sp.]
MKKINLKGITEILSEKEMKNVMGGSGTETARECCKGKEDGAGCTCNGQSGRCENKAFAGFICWMG